MTDKVSISVPVLPSQAQIQTQANGQSTIQLVRRLYDQSLTVLNQNPAIISMTVINNLMLVATLGLDINLKQLLSALKPAHIPILQKLKILDKFSNINKDAAYELALAYIGMGNFAQTKNQLAALKYFHRAIQLDHKIAFSIFLSAICDRHLKLNTKQFIDMCEDLILRHGKVEVAHTLGALMCGYTITKRHELNFLLNLKNPNLGYIYLEYVVQHGNQDLRKIAAENIVYGLDRGLFTSPDALTFIKRYNITRPAQPTAGVTMRR